MLVMELDRVPEGSGPRDPRHPFAAGTAPARRPPGNGGRDPLRGHIWQPLAGAALLERLRITGRPRPRPNPELVVELRRTLEQGIIADERGEVAPRPTGLEPAGHGDSRTPPALVVTKDRLTRVLACEAHHLAAEFGERTPTMAMACGALVDALFRQLVTVGSIGDPLPDGLAALSVDDHQKDLVSWIERLPGAERDELRAEVERQAGGMLLRWPALDPAWMPRTQEALRVGLAGGAVELSARVDLAIGGPAEDVASVAIVEVKSGTRRVEHRADLHFYALIESLRSPAPPFVVATYYTRTGELDVDPVSEELLVAAGRRALAGIRSLMGLAAGSEPRRRANGLCGSCAGLPGCEVGQRRSGTSARPLDGDEESR